MIAEATSHKAAQKIPTDLNQFKAWADRECSKWPAQLQVKAYHAWTAAESMENFKAAYSEWSHHNADR